MISVIIPTYNKNGVLRHTILSLINQGVKDYEVIVSDDGGNTNTKEMLDSLDVPFEIKYYWHEKKGFRAAKARNEGVKISSGDKIVFLDEDVILAPDSLKVFDGLDVENKYYVAIKKLMPLSFYEEKINDVVILKNFEVFETQHHGFIESTLSSIGIVSRKNFDIIEGFDEEFRGWGFEDTELMSRLKDIGIKKCKTEIIGYHVEHKGLQLNKHNRFLFGQKYKLKTKNGKKIIILEDV